MTSGCAAVTAASPSPARVSAAVSVSPAPSPVAIPPMNKGFTSPLMGYSVRYPAGWTPTPATDIWLPDASNYWDDPVGDRIESATAGFRGTSQKLAPGQSAETWLRAYLASSPSGDCGTPEQISAGGSVGTLDLNGCNGQGRLRGRVYDYAVVVGDHGYNFTMEGDVSHDLFLAMLATVTFDPESAADNRHPGAASPTP
jgi:hypothetical protein